MHATVRIPVMNNLMQHKTLPSICYSIEICIHVYLIRNVICYMVAYHNYAI